uniref:Centrosomal protein of 19 kDa n=1 Tax=Percolomonas cosmopolitus TaxID=63605 RepID=A0A7S1KNK8_9EUKA
MSLSSHFSSDFESFHDDNDTSSTCIQHDFSSFIEEDTFSGDEFMMHDGDFVEGNDGVEYRRDELNDRWEESEVFEGLDLLEYDTLDMDAELGVDTRHNEKCAKLGPEQNEAATKATRKRGRRKGGKHHHRMSKKRGKTANVRAICETLVLEYLKSFPCWDTHDAMVALLKDKQQKAHHTHPDEDSVEKTLQIDPACSTAGPLMSCGTTWRAESLIVQLLNEEILQNLDWNKIDDDILQKLKDEDEMRFQMNTVRPGDENFQHEINVEFAEPTEDCGWDSD